MEIACPRCGSTEIKRRPGMAESGWLCVKAGVFVVFLNFLLPMAVVFQYVNAIVLMILGLFAVACLFWAIWFVQQVVLHQPPTLAWKCETCKKEFETPEGDMQPQSLSGGMKEDGR